MPFYITANLRQSLTGGGGTKIIFTSSPNGHPSPRHPLMDYADGQPSLSPGPSPCSTPPVRTKERHGDTLSLPPFFGNALTLGVRAPGKLQLCTVCDASLRVYLGSSLVSRRPPGMAPQAPSQPPLQWLAGLSPSPRCAPSPGRWAGSRGRGSFHPPAAALLPPLLRVPGRADTGVGGAESLLRAGRG